MVPRIGGFMNLLLNRQVIYKYNYDELIPQLIEVSRENIKRRRDRSVATTMNAMCSISMGRQTGKTTGIIDYAKRNPNGCIVITHNFPESQYKEALEGTHTVFVSLGSITANVGGLRGIRGEYDFIFDECTTDEVYKVICNLSDARLISENMMIVRSILKVGDR
jgi:hypothetical protein